MRRDGGDDDGESGEAATSGRRTERLSYAGDTVTGAFRGAEE